MKKMQYNSVDLGKFIASIAIVALHIPPFGRDDSLLSNGVDFATSLAVPYFFAVSAFLYFPKIEGCPFAIQLSGLRHFIRRIAILYFVWLLINSILMYERNDEVWISSFPIQLLFGNTFPGSWFYSALVVCICLCFLIRKMDFSLVLPIGILSYWYFVLCKEELIAARTVYNWYETNISECFLSAPYALVWCAMGGVISIAADKKRKNLLGIYNICFIVLGLFSVTQLPKGTETISWMIRFFIVEILLVITAKYQIKIDLPYRVLRKMSTLIFMIHFFFLFKIKEDFVVFHCISLKFIITVVGTLIVSWTIVKLSDRFRLLKYLY